MYIGKEVLQLRACRRMNEMQCRNNNIETPKRRSKTKIERRNGKCDVRFKVLRKANAKENLLKNRISLLLSPLAPAIVSLASARIHQIEFYLDNHLRCMHRRNAPDETKTTQHTRTQFTRIVQAQMHSRIVAADWAKANRRTNISDRFSPLAKKRLHFILFRSAHDRRIPTVLLPLTLLDSRFSYIFRLLIYSLRSEASPFFILRFRWSLRHTAIAINFIHCGFSSRGHDKHIWAQLLNLHHIYQPGTQFPRTGRISL